MPVAVDLAHRELGAGPPLVILHGLLGSGRNWLGTARHLAPAWRCILVDQRNHGASPWAADASYPALAADIVALLDRLGIDTATLLGHSMGGKAALAAALTSPERVARLVVVDIAPVAYDEGHAQQLDAMAGLDLTQVRRRADADARLADAVPDPAMRGFLLQNLQPEGDGWAWRVNLDGLRRQLPVITDFPADLRGRTFTGPAAAIRGERSSYLAPLHQPALAACLPGVEIATIGNAGHWPHAERPDAFQAVLQDCLRR